MHLCAFPPGGGQIRQGADRSARGQASEYPEALGSPDAHVSAFAVPPGGVSDIMQGMYPGLFGTQSRCIIPLLVAIVKFDLQGLMPGSLRQLADRRGAPFLRRQNGPFLQVILLVYIASVFGGR